MNCCETIKKLKSVPTDKWFSVVNSSGYDMVLEIKQLIDSGEHFQISSDWKKFKRLNDWQ